MKTMIVEVRDVFVAYQGAAGSVMALRGSDLTLAVGERLLVQGPNGSGKTTLLRVITGELPVLAGTVVVSGTALHDLTAGQRREWRARSVGFIDQFAGRGLLPELSVLQNVSLQLRLMGVPKADAEQRAQAACARLGIDRLLDGRCHSCRGVRHSAWRSALRSRTNRSFCSPTSQRANWTSGRPGWSTTCSPGLRPTAPASSW